MERVVGGSGLVDSSTWFGSLYYLVISVVVEQKMTLKSGEDKMMLGERDPQVHCATTVSSTSTDPFLASIFDDSLSANHMRSIDDA